MTMREDYVRKMEAKLEQWNAEIDTLVAAKEQEIMAI